MGKTRAGPVGPAREVLVGYDRVTRADFCHWPYPTPRTALTPKRCRLLLYSSAEPAPWSWVVTSSSFWRIRGVAPFAGEPKKNFTLVAATVSRRENTTSNDQPACNSPRTGLSVDCVRLLRVTALLNADQC